MDGVDAGDEPVQSIEQLRARLRQRELRTGHEVLVDVLLVLESLDHQERHAECGGRQPGTKESAGATLR